jgi:hypothetical protein
LIRLLRDCVAGAIGLSLRLLSYRSGIGLVRRCLGLGLFRRDFILRLLCLGRIVRGWCGGGLLLRSLRGGGVFLRDRTRGRAVRAGVLGLDVL